jgi:hypothetical protein
MNPPASVRESMQKTFRDMQDKKTHEILEREDGILTFDDEFHKMFSVDDYQTSELPELIDVRCDVKGGGWGSGTRNLRGSRICFPFDLDCDLVSDLEISLENGVAKDIDYIEFDIGSYQFNKLWGHHLQFYNDFAGKTPSQPNHIPLSYPFNMIPLFGEKKVSVRIWIQFYTEHDIGKVELFAKKYVITNMEKKEQLMNLSGSYLMYQLQYTGLEAFTEITKNRLNYNHPICAMIVYGLDYSKIKSVSLLLNDEVYCKNTVEELQEIKKRNGFDNDMLMIFMGETFDRNNIYRNTTVNFSRTDKRYLVIETDEVRTKEEDDGFMNACINFNIVRVARGKFALEFSK